MHEHGLARELWPQLEQIAANGGFVKVTAIDMIVGVLHGVSADFLAHSFEHAFEGTSFDGAKMKITVVDPGQQYRPPNSDESMAATGWELLITRIEGETKE